MALNVKKIPFGPADFIIGEEGSEVKFDGKEKYQAEGGEIVITPQFVDVPIIDYGTGAYTKKLTGYEIRVNIMAAEEDMDTLQLALGSHVTAITDTDTTTVIGLADSPIGADTRDAAVPVRIHPRQLPVSDKSNDYYIYKMASVGEYTRSYSLEPGNVALQFEAYIRDDADPMKIGNYFYMGGVDPNSQP